ncbi:MAG: FtsH protease activity modulator HflK [Chloroflexi bacterium]|nr:FtsH protease activity modulator HflK [Chloroflexota bacterium]
MKNEKQIDWSDLWRRFIRARGGVATVLLIVIVGLAALWLMTGIYQVGPGSEGVIRQFGVVVAKTGPGLQYRLPWPIQQADVVNMEEVRRAEIGFRSRPAIADVPDEALMLTGDENIVDIHVIVQYKIKDASNYLFMVKDVGDTLKAGAEVALRGIVGQNKIDFVMIEGRGAVESETVKYLQDILDNYGSGLLVTAVKLQEVDAPEQVRDAFHDVVRAKEDKEKLMNEARGYREDLVPKARGENQQMIKAAEAYKEQRTIEARGDAEKFLKVLEEYKKAEDVTRKRLYLETMERILPGIEKIIVAADGGNLLQFLPLREAGKKLASPTSPGSEGKLAAPTPPAGQAAGKKPVATTTPSSRREGR